MISKGNYGKFARFVLLAVSEDAKKLLPGCFLLLLIYCYLLSHQAFLTYCLMLEIFCQSNFVPLICIYLLVPVPLTVVTIFFFRTIYNKTIIRFSFCDIQNNQCLGKGNQPQPSASADNPYLDLDYSGYHKNRVMRLSNVITRSSNSRCHHIPGICSFDKGLCRWRNEKSDDQFDWTIREGETPSKNTGPKTGFGGSGTLCSNMMFSFPRFSKNENY